MVDIRQLWIAVTMAGGTIQWCQCTIDRQNLLLKMSFSHFLATMVFNADLANSEDWESESVHMLLEHSDPGKLVDSLLSIPIAK